MFLFVYNLLCYAMIQMHEIPSFCVAFRGFLGFYPETA